MGNLVVGLTAAMVEKRTNLLTVSEDQLGMIAQAGVEVAGQLISQMNELGSNNLLQRCNWHATGAEQY